MPGLVKWGRKIGYDEPMLMNRSGELPIRLPSIQPTGRRRFLLLSAGVCGTLATLAARPARAFTGQARCLRLTNTHTGESLRATYYQDHCYQSDCLARVNYLLRDFRTGDVHPIDPSLLDILFDLQAMTKCDAPFEVISGYRSPVTNAMLHSRSEGVAVHSMHLEGRAIDVRLQGYPTRDLAMLARTLRRGGVGFYHQSDFVHVDTGPVRTWSS